MTVAREHEINTVGFEQRQRVFAHINQRALAIGIVRAFRVRRVMPKGDKPILLTGRQIIFEPGKHRAVDGPISVVRVEHDEVNIRAVERVVGFRPGCQATGLSILR